MSHLSASRVVPALPGMVFDFAVNPENLAELLQDHIEVQYLAGSEHMVVDAEYTFQMSRYGFNQIVRFQVTEYKPGLWLTYRQVEGLLAQWIHTQRFEFHEPSSTLLTDMVEYKVPLGLLGNLMDDLWLRRDLQAILESRLDRIVSHFQNRQSEA